MHYHIEILMPPTDDVEGAVSKALFDFCEENDDQYKAARGWWDWYEIGGRWSGEKQNVLLGRDKIKAFYDELTERGVTVSGFRAGKEQLEPRSQVQEVDALWRERFPGHGDVCPLFSHAPDRMDADVMELGKVSGALTCERFLVVNPHDDEYCAGETRFLLNKEIWNGMNRETTTWNGTVAQAMLMLGEHDAGFTAEWLATHKPQLDWPMVTVDVHS